MNLTPLGVCIYNRTHDNFKSINIDFDKKRRDFYYSFGLIEDSKGNKWTTLYPGGLFWYDPNAHLFVPYTKVWPACDANVFRISEDSNTGNYWLATDSGLTMYNSKAREYFSRRHNPANLRIFNDTVVGKSNGLLYADPNRILWMVLWSPQHEVRYYRYDVVKDKLEEIVQNMGYVVSFFTDASGVTWAVGDRLLRFSDKDRLFVEIEKKRTERLGLDFNQMYSLYEDDERNLWAGTDLGVFIFNPVLQKFSTATTYSFTQKKSIDGDINGFLQLRDGNILALGWGADGLYFYDSVMKQLPYQYGYNGETIKDNNHRLTWCGLEDSRAKSGSAVNRGD
jgi:ligand-binding sensor domain-containing protein